MLLGIDVGGTFTDAVLIGRGTIIAQAKRRTTHEAVLQGILEALDEVLQEQEVYNIERVVISSTIVTNALTEGRTDHQRRYKPGREKRIQQDHLYELLQHHLHDERCAGNRPTGQQQRGPPTGTGPHQSALSPRDEQIEKVTAEAGYPLPGRR